MNHKDKGIMWTSIFAPILIVIGVTLLVLSSLPINNIIEDNTLTVNFVIGKKVIDVTDAKAHNFIFEEYYMSMKMMPRMKL